jgi:hypothetical protein
MDNELMNNELYWTGGFNRKSYAGLTALAGRGGTSPAKASSPALVFSLAVIHYSVVMQSG